MRWCNLFLFPILLAASPLQGEPAKPAEGDNPAAEKDAFDVPVPLNTPVKGIKIPHRNDEGKLLMTIEAELATKLDESHLEMENMKIESFDDDGKTIKIELPHSILNLDTKILTGDRQALIRREDFEITGDSVEFHTKTRHATMRGKIRMIIQTADLEK